MAALGGAFSSLLKRSFLIPYPTSLLSPTHPPTLLSPHRMEVIIDYLKDKYNSAIVLLGLLPRGKNSPAQPSVYTPAIAAVNDRYR